MAGSSKAAEPGAQAARGAAGAAPRQRLNRPAILAAATRLIERDGLAALTMRRLGGELDVQAMALYHHLPNRDSLIDGVVDLAIDELYADPEVLLTPDGGWQDYLRRLAHGLRRIALAHPHLFPLVATRPPAAPWVRPPLRSLRWIESFLSGLNGEGFSDATAVYAYRAFTSFLLGHLLWEVAAHGADISTADASKANPGSRLTCWRSTPPCGGCSQNWHRTARARSSSTP